MQPADRAHVVSATADNLAEVLALLSVLSTGGAIVVGEAVPLPIRVLVERPKALPESVDPTVVGEGRPGGWDRRQKTASDYKDVIIWWRSQDVASTQTIPDSSGHSTVSAHLEGEDT